MLISLGEQNKGIPGAIYEPVANLTASILGMIYLGPVGVAWGTLFGSLCGLVWIVTRLMPVVESVNIGMPEFFRRGVLPVSLPFVPLAVFYALERRLSTVPYAVVLTLSLLCVPASIRWPLLQRRHTVS
jgi:Ca2+/Na+ antiporter